MDNLVAINIKQLRRTKGLTQDQLAERIGVNRAAVGSYEEGRAVPKLQVLTSIANLFSISLDMLINSNLTTVQDVVSIDNQDLSQATIRVLPTVVDRENEEMITLVPAKASAGYLNGYADTEYIEALPRFSLPLPELSKERTYRAFQIRGDSMEPIPSGAYIICEYVSDWHDIKDGKTYVLVTRDEGIVFKRVYFHPSGELWLKSDNPQYETYSVHLNRMLEVWKAVGYICTSLPDPDAVGLNKLSAMMMDMKREIDDLKKARGGEA